MRFRVLDIERYGAFERRRLVFRDGAALHVVHGANEAGKSTALAAVTELLYGIAPRTAYGFRFGYEDLRLGADIVDRAGRAVSFRRRKRQKATLVDAEDKPLPDDLLTPFLAGVDVDRFRSAFGLSQETLREGGKAMLDTGGEAGAALAGAAGLDSLVRLSRALESEASRLWRPRGQCDYLDAQERFDAERKLVREASLAHDAYLRRLAEIEERRAAVDAAKARREVLSAERVRLERVLRTSVALGKLERVERAAADLADLPAASPSAATLTGALDDLARTHATERAAERERARFEAELASVLVEDSILNEAEEIDALAREVSVHRKEAIDLPERRKEERAARAELDAIARELRLSGADEVVGRRPDAPALARLEEALARGERLATLCEEAAKRHAEARDAVAAAEVERRRLPPASDPGPLGARAKALAPLHDVVRRLAERHAERTRRAGDIARAAARLSPSIASLEALASLVLPARAVISDVADVAVALTTRENRLRERIAEARAEADKRQADMDKLTLGGTIVDEATLAEARARRDAAWTEARAALATGAGASASGLAAAVDGGLREADELADRRFLDARRATALALAEQERRRFLAEAETLETRDLKSLSDERSRAREAYLALWTESGIVPGKARAMLDWLDEVTRLRGAHALLGELDQDIAATRDVIAGLLPALEAIEADLGLLAPAGDAATRLRTVEAALEDTRARWQAIREAQQAIARAEDTRDRARRDEKQNTDLFVEWRARFAEALVAAGADPTSEISAAREIARLWASTATPIERLSTAARRIRDMEANAAGRQARLDALLARLGEASSAELATSVETLAGRLAVARERAARRQVLVAERSRADVERTTAETAAREARAALARLAAPFGTEDPDLLPTVARRLAERERLVAESDRLRAEIANAGEGRDLATLRAEAAEIPLDVATARRQAIADEEAEIERARDAARDALNAAERELRAATSGGKAEGALQRQMAAAADMAAVARRWGVASLGVLLLREALARHRARFQDPLVTRASAIFAGLTLADWAGLGIDYDGEGKGVFVARRPDGRTTQVDGLSEGTRDQMFLALRLASLEAFATGADPPPFLGDDLLVSFDERRAAAGLRALAEAGRHAQVILFTHHRFLVDLATETLGADVDAIAL